MSWQTLLVINLFAASFREFLYKKIADKMNPIVGLFYITLFCAIFFYVCFFLLYHSFPRLNLALSLSGSLFVLSILSYFKALKISLSQSILFQSYSILVTVILTAIFLGESKYFDLHTMVGVKVLVGTILSFIALWYLLHQKKKKEEKLEKKWFVYILGTILFGGVGSFVTVSFIHTYTPLEVLINQDSLMTLLLLVLILVRREKLHIGFPMIRATFLNGIASTVAVIAFYQALLITPVAKFYPLQQLLLVIITMFTGVIFYHEKDLFSKQKFIGIALGFVGMVLLITS